LKRIISAVCAVLMLVTSLVYLQPGVQAAAESEYPTRVINVVYDDSGSMIKDQDTGEMLDMWCQAKYSLEVFAAMLEENDTMNIYVMSDYVDVYEKAILEPPILTLRGNSDAKKNVEKVRALCTDASDTPFNAVKKAYSDLEKTDADEKWLVVLTDGVFQKDKKPGQKKRETYTIDEVNAYFAEKDDSVKVMYLAMGELAATIDEVPSQNIFYEKAATSDQILNKITEICGRIFNRNRLVVDMETMQIEFDVPMTELIVFAQGANVEISGIKSEKGKTYSDNATQVPVRYSEKATIDEQYKNVVVNRNLKGTIWARKGDYNPGTYTVGVTGAETIEVYYKPNVDIMAELIDSDGKIIEGVKALEAGEYTVTFSLVKGGTKEKIIESKLLGEVTYEAALTINGKSEGVIDSGDKVQLDEGTFQVDVKAKYLKYNSVSTRLNYTIYRDKALDLEVMEVPTYVIEGDGVSNDDEPIVVKATLEGKELTKEQWNVLKQLDVQVTDETKNAFSFKAVKGDEIGYFYVYPQVHTSSLSSKEYTKSELSFSTTAKYGSETWGGSTEGTVYWEDCRQKSLDLEMLSAPQYVIEGEGLSNADEPIVVKATLEGKELTPEQWRAMEPLSVTVTDGTSDVFTFVAEKSDEIGYFHVYPQIHTANLTDTTYTQTRVDFVAQAQYQTEIWSGRTNGTVPLLDNRRKELGISVVDSPDYNVTAEGIENDDQKMAVKVTLEGEELTEEQWQYVDGLKVTQAENKDDRVSFDVEKSELPGIFYVTPKIDGGALSGEDYDDIVLKMEAEGGYGVELWSGEDTGTAKFSDSRTLFEKYRNAIIFGLILLALLILFLGYVPPFKRYLPKKLKKNPMITCSPTRPGQRPYEVGGRYSKNRITTFIPYVPETGTIRVLPSNTGVSPLKVKAAGGNRMEITNTKLYAKRQNLTFDGQPVQAGAKKNLKKSAGMIVRYKTKDTEYTCVPNK